MTIFDRKVIFWAINVGGNNGSKVASIFLGVGAIHGIDQALGVGISFVTGMGWSIVEHSLVDWVARLVYSF